MIFSTLSWQVHESNLSIEMGSSIDALYGRGVSVYEENRKEQVKHSLIELFNAAPFNS
jgi:hypothetical protein